MIINDPKLLAEVEAAFARYETALVGDDCHCLDPFPWRQCAPARSGARRSAGRACPKAGVSFAARVSLIDES